MPTSDSGGSASPSLKPYYESGGITIYHSNAFEILPCANGSSGLRRRWKRRGKRT